MAKFDGTFTVKNEKRVKSWKRPLEFSNSALLCDVQKSLVLFYISQISLFVFIGFSSWRTKNVELKNSLNQSKKNAMNYCTKTLKNKILSSQSRYLLFQMLLALRSPRTVRQASECPTLY